MKISPTCPRVHILISNQEELVTFLLHCLVPYPFNKVCPTTYQALQRLVFAISLATSLEITNCEIGIEEDLTSFVRGITIPFINKILSACCLKVYSSSLLYLTDDLRNWR